MSDIKLALEELELMEDDCAENHERQQNILNDLESSLEAIDSLLAIEDYRQHLLEKKEISQEDLRLLFEMV